MAKEKRELTENEVEKEKQAIESLYAFIEDMSPHQLELLSHFAWKIYSGKKVKR